MIALDPIQLYDLGFGPHMVPVTPPGALVDPKSSLAKNKKSLGKAPGRYGNSGWTGVDLRAVRCDDYKTAKLWKDWGANVGFAVGDGYAVIDNDQGTEFSEILAGVFASMGIVPLRRYVLHPKHDRDAFFIRVLDLIQEGARLNNWNLIFKRGVEEAKVQLLAHDKQAVIAGIHPGTMSPYVFDRQFTGPEDIPVLSEIKYENTIRKFMDELAARGWQPVSPVSPLFATQPSMAIATHIVANGTPIDPGLDVQAILDDARKLLATIPNRVVPPGEKPTEADTWLDEYANWVEVTYALVAHLGPAIAATPDAEALWCEWSDGRPQGQPSRDVWRSAIRSEPRVGGIKLVELTRRLGVSPQADFPELKPDDPALARPTLDKLRARWALYTPGRGGYLDMTDGRIVSNWTFAQENGNLYPALLTETLPKTKKRDRKPPISEIFAQFSDMPIIDALTFEPGQPRLIPTHVARHFRFNRWKATSIQAKPVNPADVQPWLAHVEFMLQNASDADLFVSWCAFVAQHPELKPNWHFLFMSHQGLGKDTMMEPVKAAVGDGNWKTDVAKQLSAGFNDILETKLLVVGETHQPKWTTHEIDSHLKLALARPPDTLWINQKNLARYEIPNCLAVVMFSNDRNPLKLESEERRTHVINCRHLQVQPQSYYDKLWDWLKNDGTELVASYLLTRPLTDTDMKLFIGGVAPSSDAKLQLQQSNMDPVQYALEMVIHDSRAGLGPFTALLATAEQVADQVEQRGGVRRPSSQTVNAILLDMEHQKKGVWRLRADPKHAHYCGTVSASGTSARLWVLAPKAPDGREWKTFTNAELIGMWQGKPVSPPARGKVVAFPKGDPPV